MPPTPAAAASEEKKLAGLLRAVIAANAVALVLIVAMFVLGGFAVMAKVNPPKPKIEESPNALPGPMLPIPELIYNLGDGGYAKAGMQLELSTEGLKEQEITDYVNKVKKLYPLVQDTIIEEMSGQTYHQVSTPDGQEQLKEELRVKINSLLIEQGATSDVVKQVIFTSFSAQR